MVVLDSCSKNKIDHRFSFVIGLILFILTSSAVANSTQYLNQFPHPEDVQGSGQSQYARDFDRAVRLETLKEAINYAYAVRETRKKPPKEALALQKHYREAQFETGKKYGTVISGTQYGRHLDSKRRDIRNDAPTFKYLGKYYPSLVSVVRQAHDAKIALVKEQKNRPRVVQPIGPLEPYVVQRRKEKDDSLFWIIFWSCVGLVVLVIWSNQSSKPSSEELVTKWLMEEFGNTKEERREGIKACFARDSGVIAMLIDIKIPNVRWRQFLERNLTTVAPIEKFALETFYHLHNEGFMKTHDFFLGRLGLFYADGQGLDIDYSNYRGKPFKSKGLSTELAQKTVLQYYGMSITKATTFALNRLERAFAKDPANLVIAELHKKYTGNKQLGSGQFDLDISKHATPD